MTEGLALLGLGLFWLLLGLHATIRRTRCDRCEEEEA